VRNDTPAALPLIALITGLALGPVLVNPRAAMAALVVSGALGVAGAVTRKGTHNSPLTTLSTALLFTALGIFLAMRVETRATAQRIAFETFDPDRFTTIDVPLDKDWSPREQSNVLRAHRFTANGIPFDAELAVYARFPPPEIAMERTLRAEGFLRTNERGGYSLGIKSPELMSYEGTLPRWHPRAWNRALANRLERHTGTHPDEVALAQALVLGRGERLSEEMRDSFRRGGTYHLLVFSGLQIAFAAGLLAALLRWLHRPRASDWLLLSFAALAPLFIGTTASVSRASVGIALYALSRILKRPTSLENLWCVAALLRLLIEPRDLTDPSFHLTYAGAGALLFIARQYSKWIGTIVAAEIAITPLTLFHFHQFALGGSLLTLVMAPLIFAMLIVATLACAFPQLLGGIGLLHRACDALNAIGLSGFFAAPPVASLILGGSLALLALAFLRKRTRATAIALALLIPTGVAVHRSISQRSVEHPRVTFFDIGQGDAIAVRSGAQTLLVDGGRDERLLNLLADRGIRKVDAVVLSHAHPDHCGALPAVIEQFGVDRVYVTPRHFRGECAVRILEACSRSMTPILHLRDGGILHIGTIAVKAHLSSLRTRRAPENNASLVLHAETQMRRILLTGDIEKEAEIDLSDRDLRSDVLKIPHHGSRSSTSDTLLEAVAPRLAVISCGRRNLFGHPHRDVLEALEERRVRVWRTDRDGTVDVDIAEGRLYAHARRD
jgi:competence protein ComEC